MHSNAPTSDLHLPWGEQLPPDTHALEVAEGVFWLRLSLPFALNHINVWLLRDELPDPQDPTRQRQGWTLVDCGIDSPVTRQAWQGIEAHVMQGLPLLRVIVTHMHPDHMGLAHWLCGRWQAPLWMGITEYQAAKLACQNHSGLATAPALQFFAQHGWNRQKDQATAQQHMSHYAQLVPAVPTTFVRLIDGMALRIGQRQWHCLRGLGHSPEHMALCCHDDRLFISGDMLLPTISTNISVYHHEPESDPLTWFLQALEQMQTLLAPDTLVLPSHGRPFVGVAQRVAQLQAHHAARLHELQQACSQQALSAHDALPLLFQRQLNGQQMAFAMGEAIAHLNALWHAGKLQRQLHTHDGVYRFHG